MKFSGGSTVHIFKPWYIYIYAKWVAMLLGNEGECQYDQCRHSSHSINTIYMCGACMEKHLEASIRRSVRLAVAAPIQHTGRMHTMPHCDAKAPNAKCNELHCTVVWARASSICTTAIATATAAAYIMMKAVSIGLTPIAACINNNKWL